MAIMHFFFLFDSRLHCCVYCDDALLLPCHSRYHYDRHRPCIIRSAEALPILCVSDFCERERERERERDACDVNRYHAEIASDHAYDYIYTSTARGLNALVRSEPVECSCTVLDKELGV